MLREFGRQGFPALPNPSEPLYWADRPSRAAGKGTVPPTEPGALA